MNRSQWQICLHSGNSLKFQYDFVIHFHISLNSKTTAVLIGCFFIEQSSHTWREELRTNNVKAKTCLFTVQVDVQHMPFTYITYNPDFRDNNLCDKRILAITNLETRIIIIIKTETMFRTIPLFLPIRRFKKTGNIRWTTISAQILNSHENKPKWWVAPKRKTGAAAKHLLKQTAACTALPS